MSFYKLFCKKERHEHEWTEWKRLPKLLHQLKYDLSLGARVSIKEISEAEYVKGINK